MCVCFQHFVVQQLHQQQWQCRQHGVSGQGCVSYRDEQPSALSPLSNPANDESLLSLTPKLESLVLGAKTGGGETTTKKPKKNKRASGFGVQSSVTVSLSGAARGPPPRSRPLINRKTKGLSRRCHIDIPPHQNNATMIIHIWSCLQSRLLVQEEMIRNFLAQPLNICLFCLSLEGFPKDLR